MAEKIKFTRPELKKQRDALARFQKFLPTLELKKKQLMLERRRIEKEILDRQHELDKILAELSRWIAVFGEDLELERLVALEKIETTTGNIAGTEIPLFQKVVFREEAFDPMCYPIWVTRGIDVLKKVLTLRAQIHVLDRQRTLIQTELTTTSQRINLFEKVKIPEALGNIRQIKIALGDEEVAAVVRGKIAKGRTVVAA